MHRNGRTTLRILAPTGPKRSRCASKGSCKQHPSLHTRRPRSPASSWLTSPKERSGRNERGEGFLHYPHTHLSRALRPRPPAYSALQPHQTSHDAVEFLSWECMEGFTLAEIQIFTITSNKPWRVRISPPTLARPHSLHLLSLDPPARRPETRITLRHRPPGTAS